MLMHYNVYPIPIKAAVHRIHSALKQQQAIEDNRMAKLIPPLNSCLRRMTSGEKRFARRLESHLEDDYSCWYEPHVGVGSRSRYTDFIVLHPSRGLLLLEVKDWKLDSLHEVDRQFFRLLTPKGLVSVQNPLDQARQCTYSLINGLRRDPILIHHDGNYQGKLVFPYAFGVVLTQISRAEFERCGLQEVLPDHLVICRDEMTDSVDIEAFQKRLWDMFPMQFPKTMTLPQIDRVRAHLFPVIIVNEKDRAVIENLQKPLKFDSAEERADKVAGFDTPDEPKLVKALAAGEPGELFDHDRASDVQLPDVIKVLDQEQERLARNLGDGHRVIHGVAGSGKTLILGFRCLQLAQECRKPILVLCFNVTLAARLRELINANSLQERVEIRHFHEWCGEQLRAYHIPKPSFGPNYVKELVQTVIDATAAGQIPRAQYDALMIDEGHDFEPDWLRLVVGMIDPDSDSLLFLYDDAQSIYTKSSLKFTPASVGIKAPGRTTVLRVNYRNTDEILHYAYRFASQWLPDDQIRSDDDQTLTPTGAGRHGPPPAFRQFEDSAAETQYIIRCIKDQQSKGMAWSDICVVYRSKWMGEKLNSAFKAAGIPVQWLNTKESKKQLSSTDERMKLMTMHSSKGLEFPLVIIAGVGSMPGKKADPATEAKLLYVAMTRATEKLLVTADRTSAFTDILAA